MANVFISYSAGDRGHAEEISAYINDELVPNKAIGPRHQAWFYEDVQDGTPVGSHWRDVLFEKLRWADAVVCLLSENYNKSLWCAAEIATALTLGSDLLPVRVGPFEKEHSMLVAYSYADWLGDIATAKDRLKRRLLDIDAMGGAASWTAGKWPYPGLRPFERTDASVYFGRKQEMLDIVALLQSPGQRIDPELITIVGPSGCGKSSLVRAAVTPYLAGRRRPWADDRDAPLAGALDDLGRKRMWLPIRPFIPGTDPLENLRNALAASVKDYGLDVGDDVLDGARTNLSDCAARILVAAQVESDCKLLLVIDQLEQLFSLTSDDCRREFLEVLHSAFTAEGPVRAMATMRPEFLDRTFSDENFSRLKRQVYPLAPLSDDQLRQIIERPAKLAGLTIEEGLVNKMVEETGGGENLFLLALILDRLKDFRHEGDGFDLSEAAYARSGGIQAALGTQAEEAVHAACESAKLTSDEPVIATLMRLVRVVGTTPSREVLAVSEFDETEQKILDEFEQRRLVVYEHRGDVKYVAIAHDLLIEKWDKLADEFHRQSAYLGALGAIDVDAGKWADHEHQRSWLLTREDLVTAMASIGIRESRGLRLTPWRRYRPETVSDPRIKAGTATYLKQSIQADSRNRGTSMAVVTSVIALIMAIGLVGWHEKRKADDALQRETITRLVSEGEGMVSQITGEGTVRGLQQLLTANVLSRDAERDDLLSPVIQLSRTVKIFQTPEPMQAVALSPSADRVVAGGMNGHVWVWNVSDGTLVGQPLSIGDADVTSVRFSRDGDQVIATNSAGSVRVWEAASGRILADVPPPGGEVTAMAIGPDDRTIAYGRGDGTIDVVDTTGADGAAHKPLPTSLDKITALTFSPDGKHIVAGGFGQVQVLDSAGGKPEPAVKFKGERPWPVWSVAYAGDGRIAAGGWGDGGATIVLRQPTGEVNEIACKDCQQPGIQSLAFDGDGKYLVSGGVDNNVQVWNAETGARVGFSLGGHTDDVRGVAFGASGTFIVSASLDRTVRVWVSPTIDRIYERFAGYQELGTVDDRVAALSPDASRFAIANENGAFRVWYAGTGQAIAPERSGQQRLGGLAFSDAGDIATVDQAGAVERWPATSRYDRPTMVGSLGEPGHSVALSPDGSKVAAGGDKALLIWAPGSAEPRRVELGHQVTSVAFSQDGRLLAYGTDAGMVQVLDLQSGKTLFAEDQVADGGDSSGWKNVGALAFSRDGTKLASGAMGDDRVRMWDFANGKHFEMKGHELDVVAVRFTEDGRYVVSGAKDDTVQFWNTTTGLRVGAKLFDDHGNVTAVGVPAGDMEIVSVRGDGTVTTWPGPAKWQSLLCNKLTYNMNMQQWQQWVELPDRQFDGACDGLTAAPDWATP